MRSDKHDMNIHEQNLSWINKKILPIMEINGEESWIIWKNVCREFVAKSFWKSPLEFGTTGIVYPLWKPWSSMVIVPFVGILIHQPVWCLKRMGLLGVFSWFWLCLASPHLGQSCHESCHSCSSSLAIESSHKMTWIIVNSRNHHLLDMFETLSS